MSAGDEGLEPQVSARGIEPRESSHHEQHVAQQEADVCPERHQRYDSMAAKAASIVRELAQRSTSDSDRNRCLACLWHSYNNLTSAGQEAYFTCSASSGIMKAFIVHIGMEDLSVSLIHPILLRTALHDAHHHAQHRALHGVSVRLALLSTKSERMCTCRVKCFYAGVRWAMSLPKEAVLTRQALASALTNALGQVRPPFLPMSRHL